MTNLRNSLRPLLLELREHAHNQTGDIGDVEDKIIKLFRYWVDNRVLIKLRLIRANLPLSEPHCAEAREKLNAVIEDVGGASK